MEVEGGRCLPRDKGLEASAPRLWHKIARLGRVRGNPADCPHKDSAQPVFLAKTAPRPPGDRWRSFPVSKICRL